MTDKNTNQKVNNLFKKVVTMATMDAFAFLNKSHENPEIIEQVVKLLSDEETRTIFLDNNPDLSNVINEIGDQKDMIGSTIGSIELLSILGKGGMGEVYLGEDKQLQRKVAVKTIRGIYRINQQAKDRFRREALILSKLDHENVCKIYNLIEIGDVDYLVLEYVDGETLLEFNANKNKQQKLQVAAAILKGLIEAHNAGIIHRDLKPDNILVSKNGVVKILDFGISASLKQVEDKTFNQSQTTQSVSSTSSGAIRGTLGYMSPEQAKGEDISSATDIYSLGLIFQKLFSSGVIHPDSIGKTELLVRSQQGKTEPLLGVSHDLSALINRMKSPQASVRPTAIDALEQLEKIINKPKRRLKQALLAGVVALAVMGFYKYSYDLNTQKQQAIEARLQAEDAKREAEQISEFLIGLFEVSHPYKNNGETITARQLLDEAANNIDTELTTQPLTVINLKLTMGEIYRQLSLYDSAEKQLLQAQKLYKDNKIDNPELYLKVLKLIELLRFDLSDFKGMDELLKELLTFAEAHNLTSHSIYYDAKYDIAVLLSKRGKQKESIAAYQELLEYAVKNSANLEKSTITKLHNSIGLSYWRLGELKKAEESMLKAIELLDPSMKKHLEVKSSIFNNISNVYANMENYDKAFYYGKESLKMEKKTFGDNHPSVALSYDNLATTYYMSGDMEECIKYNGMALEIYANTVGKNHQDYAITLANRAVIFAQNKNYESARDTFIEVIATYKKIHGKKHYLIAGELNNLGKVYDFMDEFDNAIESLQASIRMNNDLGRNINEPRVMSPYWTLAYVYRQLDKTDKALEVYQTMIDEINKTKNPSQEKINEVKAEMQEARAKKLKN